MTGMPEHHRPHRPDPGRPVPTGTYRFQVQPEFTFAQAAEQVDYLAADATGIIEANEGKVTKTETWGLKNLAYKIDRNRKAHYVLLNIEGPGDVVAELERQTRINEDVIRYLTIRVDEHETGPSVMMRKNERDRKRREAREERD